MAEVSPLCLVCGDKSSGRHYGILTCDGCRGFFKRSVRRSMGYICREKNKCVVDLNRRNQCQACRMQKCLAVGMKKEAVQHERAPRLPKNRVHQFSPYPRIVDYSQMIPTSNDRARNSLNRALPPSPPNSPKQTFTVSSSQDLYEISVHLLYQTIHWARNIPTFSDFPANDQALLLENGWCGLFLLSLAQWKIPLDSQYLIGLGKQHDNVSKEDVLEQNQLNSNDEDCEKTEDLINNVTHLQSVIQKFRSMNLDPIEYSYLKAILLFNANLRDIKDCKHVESLQDQAQMMLQEYAISKQRRGKFGKVLLKVPLLLEFSHRFILRQFFKGSLENINKEMNSKRRNPKSVSPSYEVDHDYNNNEYEGDNSKHVTECEDVEVDILKIDTNEENGQPVAT